MGIRPPYMGGVLTESCRATQTAAPIWAVWREDERSSRGRVFPMCVPCCGAQSGGQTQRGSDGKNTQQL